MFSLKLEIKSASSLTRARVSILWFYQYMIHFLLCCFKWSNALTFSCLKLLGPENYKRVGCYRFKELKMLGIFGKTSYKKVKASSGTAVNQCIQMASDNNYSIIGIQKLRRNIVCRKGNKRLWKPEAAISKLDSKKCKANVGSRKAIVVYQKTLGIKY